MLVRLATGLVLAPLAIWLVVAGPALAVVAVLAIVFGGCAFELVAMVAPDHRGDRYLAGALCTALVWLGAAPSEPLFLYPVAAALLVPGLWVLLRIEPIEMSGRRLLGMWGSLFYLGATGVFAVALVTDRAALMIGLFIVWAGDTGAFFAGKTLGKHKLYPLVSPKKTIEGSIGGVLGSVGGALLGWVWLAPDRAVWTIVLVGAVGSVIAAAGDLVESALKRAAGVKDSGAILPGHGGFFDRMDGFVFAAPFFALALL
ncbi:MAG: phosphatidate cytidylyltransferase [Myxococcota bacterium]|nr:phosphatidate cytidylyltransferase [Myxococcota bacterium]